MRKGDILRVRENVLLESGSVLRMGQRCRAFSDETGGVIGIEWRDAEGLHSMAISTDKVKADREGIR